jgi:hypothetical protein
MARMPPGGERNCPEGARSASRQHVDIIYKSLIHSGPSGATVSEAGTGRRYLVARKSGLDLTATSQTATLAGVPTGTPLTVVTGFSESETRLGFTVGGIEKMFTKELDRAGRIPLRRPRRAHVLRERGRVIAPETGA